MGAEFRLLCTKETCVCTNRRGANNKCLMAITVEISVEIMAAVIRKKYRLKSMVKDLRNLWNVRH